LSHATSEGKYLPNFALQLPHAHRLCNVFSVDPLLASPSASFRVPMGVRFESFFSWCPSRARLCIIAAITLSGSKLTHNEKMKSAIFILLVAVSLNVAAQSPAVVLERDFYFNTLRAQLALERFVPPKSVLFIGDSIIQNFEVTGASNDAINFGISGDTTVGVLHRVRQYQSINEARAVVLESGVNDLGFGEKFDKDIPRRYAKMMEFIPEDTPVYILAILPVNEKQEKSFSGYNGRIAKINKSVKYVCRQRPKCTHINVNYLLQDSGGHLKDNIRRDAVHLNEKGYRLLSTALFPHIFQRP
jgi:lysophospholipase L1-like esterase